MSTMRLPAFVRTCRGRDCQWTECYTYSIGAEPMSALSISTSTHIENTLSTAEIYLLF